jgi:CheY-like chemotaxis protein
MQPNHKGNVLIVDNDDRILWAFQEHLENAGFTTEATWSGHEALALLGSGKFDILLVDDYLPDIHSHDFLERVGRLSNQPSIVIMHSAEPKPADVHSYASLDVAELVDKRDPVKVCRAVSSCLAEHKLPSRSVN